MLLDINASIYKSINEALIHGQNNVPAKGIWLTLHKEYNIGNRCDHSISLSSTDRVNIANIVKSQTDLDPRIDNYKDLKNLSRTQVSIKTRHEKLISLPPREKFIEYRVLNQAHVAPGYQGILVDDLVEKKIDVIISIENFDVFANIQIDDLICVKTLSDENLHIVFAGDNKASPKAIKHLRENTKATWVHFGDYDPAGIHIGINRLKAHYIITPATNINNLKALNNPQKHQEQYMQLNSINHNITPEICQHMTFIIKHNIAIMQEQLISHKTPLQLNLST